MALDHAIEAAERSLVATCVTNPDLLDDLESRYTDFRNADMSLIYRTLHWLNERNDPITAATVMERIGNRVSSDSLIDALDPSGAAAWAIKDHDRIVRESGRKRALNDFAMKVNGIANQTDTVTDETMAQLQAALNAFEGDDESKSGLVHVSELLPAHLETIEERYRNHGTLPGCDTGFQSLNAITGGLRTKKLVVIGARPSMGKTALMEEMSLAVSRNDAAAVFSLEMDTDALLDRAYATTTPVKMYQISHGLIKPEEWSKVTDAYEALAARNLYYDDKPSVTVAYISGRVRKIRRKIPDGKRLVVFVDYLQLIRPDDYRASREQQIAGVSRGLRDLAKNQDCCVVALAQLNRSVEQRQDKRPILADLRDSGQIEQDADVIGMLYRDEYYNTESEKKNEMDIIIAKQRDGKTGTVTLEFLREYQRIQDLPQRSEP